MFLAPMYSHRWTLLSRSLRKKNDFFLKFSRLANLFNLKILLKRGWFKGVSTAHDYTTPTIQLQQQDY